MANCRANAEHTQPLDAFGVCAECEAIVDAVARRAADWLDQPLTPEESATIRDRMHGPMMPLPEDV